MSTQDQDDVIIIREKEIKEDRHTTSPLKKEIGIRVFFLILAILAFSGVADTIGDKIMGSVNRYNSEFLKDSLINASFNSVGLAFIKGQLASFTSIVIEPSILGSKLGKIEIGKMIDGLKEIVDDIFHYMRYTILFIMVQMASIKLIKSMAIKMLFGMGSLLCLFQYKKNSFFGKIGLSLIIFGITLYIIYPLFLYSGAIVCEVQRISTIEQLFENIGIIKERFIDIDLLSISHSYDNLKQFMNILYKGLTTPLYLATNYLMLYLLMFGLVPLLTIGVVYFIINQALTYLDMPEMASGFTNRLSNLADKFGPRTRSRLSKH